MHGCRAIYFMHYSLENTVSNVFNPHFEIIQLLTYSSAAGCCWLVLHEEEEEKQYERELKKQDIYLSFG